MDNELQPEHGLLESLSEIGSALESKEIFGSQLLQEHGGVLANVMMVV